MTYRVADSNEDYTGSATYAFTIGRRAAAVKPKNAYYAPAVKWAADNGVTEGIGGGLFGFIGMLLGVPVFVVIYAGLERLVDHGLKKRGLQTETAEYMDLDYIDDATMQPVRLPQEVPDESLKDSKDDSAK